MLSADYAELVVIRTRPSWGMSQDAVVNLQKMQLSLREGVRSQLMGLIRLLLAYVQDMSILQLLSSFGGRMTGATASESTVYSINYGSGRCDTLLADDRYTTWDGKIMIYGIESISEIAMVPYWGQRRR